MSKRSPRKNPLPQAYGWFGGGWTGSESDVVDRIALATDTVTAVDRCNLSAARRDLAAFADATYGWFGGGKTVAVFDVVDRIAFADDAVNALDRCNLSTAREGPAAFTNNTYGWFGGGNTNWDGNAPTSTVDRITLANDTVNAASRCALTVARFDLTAFATTVYGWFGGGWLGWIPAYKNEIDRITLAADTTNAIDRCNLTAKRRDLAGFADNMFGWFGGGYTGGYSNVIERITFMTDTVNAIDRCDLIAARWGLTAITDNVYGWFGGGYTGSTTDMVDRITLANDTANALDRCNLFVGRNRLAGFNGSGYYN